MSERKCDIKWRKLRDERVAKIQPLLDKGLMPTQISNSLDISLGVVNHIIRRYCKRPYIEKYGKPADWRAKIDGTEEVDASHLTAEQREHAKRVGMTEGRYAWLMTCDKGMHHAVAKPSTSPAEAPEPPREDAGLEAHLKRLLSGKGGAK